jgi:hypothetical protein
MKHTLKLGLLSFTLLSSYANAHFFGHDANSVHDNNYNINYTNNNNANSISTASIDSDLRQGWMASVGFGFHATSLDDNYIGNTDSDAESGLATSFKVGYNFTEQFSLQYVRNVSWYTPEDDLLATGIMGLGATYYFQPQAETLYISLTAGVGDVGNIDASTSDTGSAVMFTLGYEFSPHWQLEASWLGTSIDYDYNDVTKETSSVQFLLNYSWY